MKKIVLFISIIMLFNSCYKDNLATSNRCGVVINHQTTGSLSYRTFSLVVRLQNGSVVQVPVTSTVWTSFSVGRFICF